MNYGGIMYFPLNVNFFDDAPIELVEAKCGLAGITAVIKLLCKMYKEKGYYLLWDKEQCTLFAHKTGIEETNMEKIICILIDKGFFDRKYYEEQYVLTSATIQRVWLEATKRRKRDLNTLPYLLESCIQDEENSIPNKEYCMQPANISSQNADISEQSKVKQIKAETEEGSSDEHSLLPVPGYAYNKKTHNLEGLMLELQQLHIVDRNEINAILRLSDYGRLGGYVFKIISSTRWSAVLAKGKYVIAALRKEKTGNG